VLKVPTRTAPIDTTNRARPIIRARNTRVGATMSDLGNSTQTAHGVPRMGDTAPRRLSPFVARYSATPLRARSTGGGGTTPDRFHQRPPAVLPISITASTPTRRLSTSGGLTDRIERATTYPSRADVPGWPAGDGVSKISSAESWNTTLPTARRGPRAEGDGRAIAGSTTGGSP